jgi:hypothetical protein
MESDYDIFEKFPDTSLRFLIRVQGTRHVPKVLEDRGKQTANECFAMNIRTREVIARVNDANDKAAARRAKLKEQLINPGPVKPGR